MHWQLKGGIQKILGVLPGGATMHYQLQRKFGGLRSFEREFDIKVDDWQIMLTRLHEAGISIAGRRLFEIGSGWYPTFPLACYLAGAARVTTVDLNRHMKRDLLMACANRLENTISLIAGVAQIDEALVRSRQQTMLAALERSTDLALATDGVVVYAAPADASQTDLGDDQVDLIFSNSVLEHVPPEAIDGMYREAMRILAPGGSMFHSVNCGDHYAYVDRSIDQLHYLRYSDAQWARWNNAFLYQNRLRAHTFVERAEAAGFTILLNTAHATEQRLGQLSATPLHAQFATIEPERLCITSVDFIARKPASNEFLQTDAGIAHLHRPPKT